MDLSAMYDYLQHNTIKLFKDRDAAAECLIPKIQSVCHDIDYFVCILKGGFPIGRKLQSVFNSTKLITCPITKICSSTDGYWGIGALCVDGKPFINRDACLAFGETEQSISQKITMAKEKHFALLVGLQYSPEELSELCGHNVLVIDDGIATGYSIIAAYKSIVKYSTPRSIIIATPVISSYALNYLSSCLADVNICYFYRSDDSLFLVDAFYENFHQLTIEDIK